MSVIAWDGKSLASDKRALSSGMIRVTTKISRTGSMLVGYVGAADVGEEMRAWHADGAVPGDFPSSARDKDGPATLVVVREDGSIWLYERGPYPIRHDAGQQFAAGSGRDFALMAMHLGKTAEEAVELASMFESGCGNGVDVLDLVPT